MAITVDKESAYKGERIVRDSLEAFLADDVVIYNNREVNGREYDICVVSPDMCVFIIEVKGWLADKINVLGIDDIEVEGYSENQTSPKKQAKSYCIQYVNKLKKIYGESPLVVDLVAYPYIKTDEYYTKQLNIISEEQFTILKEDIENRDRLILKLQNAYNSKRSIPHAELSAELIERMRKYDEIGYVGKTATTKVMYEGYSVLSIIPKYIDDERIDSIIQSYFSGVKHILFFANRECYRSFLNHLEAGYRKEGIVHGDKLSIGEGKPIDVSRDSFVAFNMQVYCVAAIENKFDDELRIVEGKFDGVDDKLEWLAENSGFNLQQYRVEHANPNTNTLVEAGAGTGKTYSMVSRVAFLCNKDKDNLVDLETELAMVTFTNDAANNMKNRLKQMFINYYLLTGAPRYLNYVDGVERANICTIHKFSLELMKKAHFYTGLGTNYSISSDEYSRGKIYDAYLNKFLDDMEEQNGNFINEIPVPVFELKKQLQGIANTLLQKSINLDSIQPSEMGVTVDNAIPYFNDLIQYVVIPSELEYLNAINDRNAIDLKECIILLNKVMDYGCDTIRNSKLKYIFVDEFQDTDDVQIEVFQKLQRTIRTECRLFVVGDLKQSIYRFRGANLSAFSKLCEYERYPWDVFHLNRNYRTDFRLLEKYDDVFEKMGRSEYLPYRKPDDCLVGVKEFAIDEDKLFVEIPCHGVDEKVFFDALFDSINVEIEQIQSLIDKAAEKEASLSIEERTIAVLVRSNWQIDKIVDEAKRRSINIEINSGGDLYQLESTKDLYKLLLAVENPWNPIHLMNFIDSNYIDMTLNYHLLQDLSEYDKVNELITALDMYLIKHIGKTWNEVLDEIYSQPVLFAIKELYDELKPWANYSKSFSRRKLYAANFDYLIEKIIRFARFDTLTVTQVAKYLEINILTGQKELARTEVTDDDGIHIICTTIHKSKGLEYGTVIIPYTFDDISDVRKGKLDANYSESRLAYSVRFENKVRERNSNYNESIESDEQTKEESRILYVAMTRAIRNCIWINNIDSTTSMCWRSLLEG